MGWGGETETPRSTDRSARKPDGLDDRRRCVRRRSGRRAAGGGRRGRSWTAPAAERAGEESVLWRPGCAVAPWTLRDASPLAS